MMRRQQGSGTFSARNARCHAAAVTGDRMEAIAPPPNVRGMQGHSPRSRNAQPRAGLVPGNLPYSTVKTCMKAKRNLWDFGPTPFPVPLIWAFTGR